MKSSTHLSKWLFSLLILFTATMPVVVHAQGDKPVVVISPGHGWWDPNSQKIDPGASNGDLVEKDINLDVARYARDYLSRCPVDVYLTRNGDDKDHTLSDVDEIVNEYGPTVGISIHTNSGTGSPSGTEGWYTVGGYDDEHSQQLAASLADHIASRLKITDRGAKPETDNRHSGLYIHWWDAPSALIEIAFLQGDAELLRTQKDDFGRSIAQAILEYLDIDPHCADSALPQGAFLSTYFPGDTKTNEINLRNDSLVKWEALDYLLVSQGNEFGADVQYPLFQDTSVDEVATWEIPAVAPARPGIFRQEWQLMRDADRVGKKVTVYLIVVPKEARQLKEDIDQQIEELRQRGEEEIERFIERLEQEAIDWVTQELPNLICGQQLLLIGFAAGMILVIRTRRR
jgi:N-acetylmuramoyl-L-alanine amidase